ncbi:MAG TPA: ABC transporter ATP-binding protein, partial [Saprospirales bacterium]|nr:ABC transporter ATP-binding protein [Saprospirales bacterium]HRQ30993.1 ATP-binding cassette domain-containing protein [Saprospiraceae bacterium]
KRASIFGLLGPNGAGKTTLIRIITSITGADEGTVYFNGEPLNKFHPTKIGYLPEERGLYKKMKIGEHLLYLAQLKGMDYKSARKVVLEWLDKFEIRNWWNKKVEELSKGMQQKVQFIATVMHDPELIILDEPFSGLDPINTNLIKSEIYKLKEKGTTIIFSTHRMEQVEEICEEIALIDKGKVILRGRVDDIKQQFKEHKFEVSFNGQFNEEMIRGKADILDRNQDSLIFKLQGETGSNQLLMNLIQQGLEIKSFSEILPGLNEIFIREVEENAL